MCGGLYDWGFLAVTEKELDAGGYSEKESCQATCQPNRLFQLFGFSSKIHELCRLDSLEWGERDFSDDADACYAGPVIDDDDDNDYKGGDDDDDDDDNDDDDNDDYKSGKRQ